MGTEEVYLIEYDIFQYYLSQNNKIKIGLLFIKLDLFVLLIQEKYEINKHANY